MFWESSALWGIIGLIGGFLVSTLFHFINKRKRKISYSIITSPIIVNKISKITDLVIKYKNKDIDNLSISKITLKNAGNEILKSTDFAELNKLSLTTNGQFLIDSSNDLEIVSSNPYIKADINLISSNKIEIEFDFLESKNTITCSIFHTGDVTVCGSIIGGRLISNDVNTVNSEQDIIKQIKSLIFIMTILAFLMILYYFKIT